MNPDQGPAFGVGDASFQAAGGEPGLQRLVADFYQVMDLAPEAAGVRAMYPADVSDARDRLASFLSGWLGGPKRYAEKYGGISIPQFHTRWQVGEAERDAWLFCMEQAIARQPFTPEFAEYLATAAARSPPSASAKCRQPARCVRAGAEAPSPPEAAMSFV